MGATRRALSPAQQDALDRVTPRLSEGDAICVREQMCFMGRSLDHALDAVGRDDLISVKNAGGSSPHQPARSRRTGSRDETGVRALSQEDARPGEVTETPGPGVTMPGHLPVGPGARDDLAPPFWLARLRGIEVSGHGD